MEVGRVEWARIELRSLFHDLVEGRNDVVGTPPSMTLARAVRRTPGAR